MTDLEDDFAAPDGWLVPDLRDEMARNTRSLHGTVLQSRLLIAESRRTLEDANRLLARDKNILLGGDGSTTPDS